MIDTHSHIYLSAFDEDRDKVVERAISAGIEKIFLPNIDHSSIEAMTELCERYPQNCYPMMGLHPTSVDENFEKELETVDALFEKKRFIAVGECGIDLYWDKKYVDQQKQAFAHQIKLAIKYDIPIVIHARDSFNEIYKVIEKEWTPSLKGVFHSFTGEREDVNKIKEFGFHFGINGIVTFKNSNLKDVIKHIGMSSIILETDSPYLSPVPKRGKRNESSHLVYIAEKLSEVFEISIQEVGEVTTSNTHKLFHNVMSFR